MRNSDMLAYFEHEKHRLEVALEYGDLSDEDRRVLKYMLASYCATMDLLADDMMGKQEVPTYIRRKRYSSM